MYLMLQIMKEHLLEGLFIIKTTFWTSPNVIFLHDESVSGLPRISICRKPFDKSVDVCYSTVEPLWKQLWYFVLKHRWPIPSPNPLNENIQRLRPKMLCQDKEKWNPKSDSAVQPNMIAVLPLDVSCGSKLSGLMATLNQFPIKILRCIRTFDKNIFLLKYFVTMMGS